MKKQEKHTIIKQLVLVSIFAVLPVLMIFFNGKALMQSIIWQKEETFGTTQISKKTIFKDNATLQFGVYDPKDHADEIDGITYELVYIGWTSIEVNDLLLTLNEIISSGRLPFIICEPWSLDFNNKDYLKDITKGGYDIYITTLIEVIQQIDETILIAWGHEMDQELAERYSWSGKNPVDFIMAYRYVVDYIEKLVGTKVQWVWAPVGRSDCLKYYPGEFYVDAIGFPIYSFPQWDVSYYGKVRDFKTTMDEKYRLLSAMNKPIYITEFGVTGNSEQVNNWMHQTAAALPAYPQIEGLTFFMAEDAEGAWGDEVTTPNWLLPNKSIVELMDIIVK